MNFGVPGGGPFRCVTSWRIQRDLLQKAFSLQPKADVDQPKIIVGRGAVGLPICLCPPNDLLGLVITEGIEDALSMREATGLGAWAAGCASRLPDVAEHVSAWMDGVTVLVDGDPQGERYGPQLRNKLLDRGIHCELIRLCERRAAA